MTGGTLGYVEIDSTPKPNPSGLYWSVKRSFVTYLSSMAGGSFTIDGGSDFDATGLFRFPNIYAASPAPNVWMLRFGGTVRFSGHFGALDMAIVEPTVEMSPSGGSLSSSAVGTGGRRIHLATVHPSPPTLIGETLLWPSLIPELTDEGSELFGGAYPWGTELDAIQIAISTGGIGPMDRTNESKDLVGTP